MCVWEKECPFGNSYTLQNLTNSYPEPFRRIQVGSYMSAAFVWISVTTGSRGFHIRKAGSLLIRFLLAGLLVTGSHWQVCHVMLVNLAVAQVDHPRQFWMLVLINDTCYINFTLLNEFIMDIKELNLNN